jgi:gallate dioxygenase
LNPQLEGVEALGGTYPFDVARSVERMRINRFFWSLTQPAFRERFVADEAGLVRESGLSDEEAALVRARDWLGLVRYGANFFVLEKALRVLKVTNLHAYAQMRGETFEEFLRTRRVPEMR